VARTGGGAGCGFALALDFIGERAREGVLLYRLALACRLEGGGGDAYGHAGGELPGVFDMVRGESLRSLIQHHQEGL